MNDPVDHIMVVMEEAFDPAYGEAWNRAQVSDALLLPHTHYQLSFAEDDSEEGSEVRGFTLSRHAADEEELLLIAVRPKFRGKGIGRGLMERFREAAKSRGVRNLFLEMRDGNEAEILYHRFGFTCIGRRKGYYRRARNGPLDALTFKSRL